MFPLLASCSHVSPHNNEHHYATIELAFQAHRTMTLRRVARRQRRLEPDTIDYYGHSITQQREAERLQHALTRVTAERDEVQEQRDEWREAAETA